MYAKREYEHRAAAFDIIIFNQILENELVNGGLVEQIFCVFLLARAQNTQKGVTYLRVLTFPFTKLPKALPVCYVRTSPTLLCISKKI
jgi:hypothetical protein